jgi:NADPH-dependent glutamate synthase beta subunit-like oxidoreductase/NAD(P)H-flavin reductase
MNYKSKISISDLDLKIKLLILNCKINFQKYVMPNSKQSFLNPIFGYTYEDLYNPLRLKSLTEDFYSYYERKDKEKFQEYKNYIDSKGAGFPALQISGILIDASLKLSDFLINLFQLENEQEKFIKESEYEKDILIFKKDFVQRRVFKKFKQEDLDKLSWSGLNEFAEKIKSTVFPDYDFKNDEEKFTAKFILEIAELEKNYRWFYEGDKFAPEDFKIPAGVKEKAENLLTVLRSENIIGNTDTEESRKDLNSLREILDKLEKWIFAKKFNDENTEKWSSYFEPKKVNYEKLVDYETPDVNFPEMIQTPAGKKRMRTGFKLTDPRMEKREVLKHVDYCMYCHDREKDSCSKGLSDRFGNKKFNPLGIKLDGCPLDEKISEMHYVRKQGFPVASLALIVIDNPNVPGTGHRICNDCMKSCIFQNQEPVNIPQIETNILTDVFSLPYGYEIYSLLTRWNPLNIKRPYALPYNGKNVMVVGMGPAGYTLTHFLLNEGFGVAGTDGLKIEKVHEKYTGTKDEKGFIKFPEPVKYFDKEIRQDLDKRILQGFGGVSEYGITVRWDKNFLTAIYINIARRENFRLYDGVRFGGTITVEDAWKLGFDHIAMATGAGKPTIIRIKNNLIRGIRKASDFLMALQLTGAAKEDNLANLQLQLPAIVIGGGLTAIDTATESLAYYPVQVLKALDKFEKIVNISGEETFWKIYDDEEKEIMKTFIEHGKEIRNEMENAVRDKRKPDTLSLLNKWGGVTIVYRKKLTDSPAYRLNHEEIIEGFKEGIRFAEKLSPVEAVRNKYGAVDEMKFEIQETFTDPETKKEKLVNSGKYITFKAKSVMVAAGTSPNVVYEKEHPGTFRFDETKYFFKPYTVSFNDKREPYIVPSEDGKDAFFTSYKIDDKLISYYGDNHPVYAGNVVKAMASAKDGYEKIVEIFSKETALLSNDIDAVEERKKIFYDLISKMNYGLTATVEDIIRLTPTIVEVIVKAPFAAAKFRPGQFYRLQNYETNSEKRSNINLTMEGLAMTGAWTDVKNGLLSMIVLEIGVTSRLVAKLKKGERVVVMGPTGSPTEIPEGETVLLAGGGLGNAVLFSIADALKKRGNRVIYFAGYKNSSDVYKMDEVESGTDQVVWSNDFGDEISPRRKQDLSFKGNIVQSMKAYSEGKLGKALVDFKDVKRIIAIGSDRMMNAVREARHTIFKDVLGEHVGVGSINSTMQCMMKEICAQCLQRHIDPETGKESFVFSCLNQDQLLDEVDFQNLNERLKANSVLEKLNNLFFSYLMNENEFNHKDFKGQEKTESIMEGH